MTQMVPYLFPDDEVIPTVASPMTLLGQAQCVYIVVSPEIVDDLSEQMQRWFAGRPEIALVDVGTTDKQGLGFILFEWMEREIDPLFVAQLRDADMIGDYTTYGRTLGGE